MGLAFILLKDGIVFTNINLEIIMPVINGISVASLLFAFSDFIEEVILNRKYVISLKKLLNNGLQDIENELELYKAIEGGFRNTNEFTEKYKMLNKYFFLLSSISNKISVYAFPISILLTIVYFNIDAYTSTGINLTIFGLFILAYASKENRKSQIQLLIIQVWMEYYKVQVERANRDVNVDYA